MHVMWETDSLGLCWNLCTFSFAEGGGLHEVFTNILMLQPPEWAAVNMTRFMTVWGWLCVYEIFEHKAFVYQERKHPWGIC